MNRLHENFCSKKKKIVVHLVGLLVDRFDFDLIRQANDYQDETFLGSIVE